MASRQNSGISSPGEPLHPGLSGSQRLALMMQRPQAKRQLAGYPEVLCADQQRYPIGSDSVGDAPAMESPGTRIQRAAHLLGSMACESPGGRIQNMAQSFCDSPGGRIQHMAQSAADSPGGRIQQMSQAAVSVRGHCAANQAEIDPWGIGQIGPVSMDAYASVAGLDDSPGGRIQRVAQSSALAGQLHGGLRGPAQPSSSSRKSPSGHAGHTRRCAQQSANGGDSPGAHIQRRAQVAQAAHPASYAAAQPSHDSLDGAHIAQDTFRGQFQQLQQHTASISPGALRQQQPHVPKQVQCRRWGPSLEHQQLRHVCYQDEVDAQSQEYNLDSPGTRIQRVAQTMGACNVQYVQHEQGGFVGCQSHADEGSESPGGRIQRAAQATGAMRSHGVFSTSEHAAVTVGNLASADYTDEESPGIHIQRVAQNARGRAQGAGACADVVGHAAIAGEDSPGGRIQRMAQAQSAGCGQLPRTISGLGYAADDEGLSQASYTPDRQPFNQVQPSSRQPSPPHPQLDQMF